MSTRENELKSIEKISDISEVKYGDADLCSKRRKLHEIEEQDEDEHEDDHKKEEKVVKYVNTSDGGCEESYLHFENNAYENCCQSSFLDTTSSTSSLVAKNHIQKHGVVSSPTITSSKIPSYSLKSNLIETSAKNIHTITNKPSVSSKGFENTFKLLQHQVETNTQKTIDLLKTIDPSKTSHRESSSSTLSSQSGLYVVREEEPTCLELELEAMQRIQTFVNELERDSKKGHPNRGLVSTPLLALLYNFVSRGLSQDFSNDSNSTLQSEKLVTNLSVGPNVNLMYHVGKGSSGSKCLKIVRNLLNHEEGIY